MRKAPFSNLAWIAAAAMCWAASPARAAELYVAGDLGISWFGGEGEGRIDVVPGTDKGSNDDATPVFGGALGMVFPLNAALPARVQIPWLVEEAALPDWEVRTEVEYLTGRDAEIATPSFAPNETYRVDAQSWTVMAKARLDVPLRTPVRAAFGRVPFLEPLSIYAGGGAGMAFSKMNVSGPGAVTGKDDIERFAWQALAGFGYDLTDRVKLSLGWRYLDLGSPHTRLEDTTGTDQGRYSIDLEAHEFTASLGVRFWQLPPLLGED
jgi:opacity protein-like surface antigen